MELSHLATSEGTPHSTTQYGHQYSSVTVNDQAYLHQGDVYNQNIILPQPKPDAGIECFGVRLGNAPQISADAFKGRDNDLELLRKYLSPPGHTARQIVSIVGIGGVGKTQLSLAYAREYGHHYSTVFWISANDETILRRELVLLHDVIFPDSTNTVSTMQTPEGEQLAIERVNQWFSRPDNDKWLLILDNYDNPDFSEAGPSISNGFDIRPFFPHRSQGSIIVTTRSTRLFFSDQLHLGKLKDVTTSVSILSQRSRRDLSQGMTKRD